VFRRALWITLVGNLILAISKGILAYLSGSVAIYADAANSVADLMYSLLMGLGLWIAQQPPDLSHPQGHSRFEPLAGLVIAAAMTFAGYEAARASVVRFLAGGTTAALGWPSFALLGSAAVKTGMFLMIRHLARRVASPTLDTVAQDNLADMLTSAGAFAGMVGASYLHPLTDPVAGLLVAAWIFRAAYEAWRENLHYLTGGGADAALRKEIARVAGTVEGVQRVHQVITEYVGPRLAADLHINVDGALSLAAAHELADEVTARVEALSEVDRAYVHVEPYEREDDASL
jgi:cation diffusion facilitator family transporter